MNVLFCGSEIKGNFIKDICHRKKDNVEFTGSQSRIKNYEEFIFKKQFDVLVFDISNLIDECEIIVNYLLRVRKAKNCKIIVYASGYSRKSILISQLIQQGFINFILAIGQASQNDEFEKCINNYYEINGIQEEEPEETECEFKVKEIKSLGICGTLERIGTTTMSLQFVKYLLFRGYTAAYMEVNNNNYVERCKQLYTDVKEHTEEGYITYNNIDMYTDVTLLNDISNKYDYLVYDYGSFTAPEFNKISFLEKDIKIFVTGSKPNEFDKMQPVLQSPAYQDAYYIFNFVPEGDKKDLLEMMCEKAEKTIFGGYCPDPFDYVATGNYFEKILDVDQIDSEFHEENNIFNKLIKGRIKHGKK